MYTYDYNSTVAITATTKLISYILFRSCIILIILVVLILLLLLLVPYRIDNDNNNGNDELLRFEKHTIAKRDDELLLLLPLTL